MIAVSASGGMGRVCHSILIVPSGQAAIALHDLWPFLLFALIKITFSQIIRLCPHDCIMLFVVINYTYLLAFKTGQHVDCPAYPLMTLGDLTYSCNDLMQ